MKNKKVAALLMACVLAVSSLAGCGGSSDTAKETSSEEETEEAAESSSEGSSTMESIKYGLKAARRAPQFTKR